MKGRRTEFAQEMFLFYRLSIGVSVKKMKFPIEKNLRIQFKLVRSAFTQIERLVFVFYQNVRSHSSRNHLHGAQAMHSDYWIR